MMDDFLSLKEMSSQELRNMLAQLDDREHRLRAKHISTLSIERERKSIELILRERSSRRKRREIYGKTKSMP